MSPSDLSQQLCEEDQPSLPASSFPKPKHPLSAYNLFFQLERKRILNGTDAMGLAVTADELITVRQEHKTKGKRKHRKSHGKISFRDLARTIAARWKTIDATTRRVLDEQAALEKREYDVQLQAWKAANAPPSDDDDISHSSPSTHKPQQQQPVSSTSSPARDAASGLQMLQDLRNRIIDQMMTQQEFSSSLQALASSAESSTTSLNSAFHNNAAATVYPPVATTPLAVQSSFTQPQQDDLVACQQQAPRTESPQLVDDDDAMLLPLDWQEVEDALQFDITEDEMSAANSSSDEKDDERLSAIRLLEDHPSAAADLCAFLDPEEMDKLFED